MNRFRNLTITTKLTLLFILFAALILIGVGSLAFYSGRAALEQAVISDLESTANEKQAAFNSWLDYRLNLVVSITAFPAYRTRVNSLIHDDLDAAARKTLQTQIAQDLGGFIGPTGNYTEMMIVDAHQGQVIVSTKPENQGKYKEDRPYFIEGMKGPFIQNVLYSLSDRSLMLVVAAPMKADDGSVIAVLAASLKLEQMNEIILRRTGQRETDDALLVNPSNLFVTQPRFLTDPAVLQRGVHTDPVNRCLAGNSGVIAANDYRGVPVLAVYRWIPERQTCLIVKMDQVPSNAFGQNLAMISIASLAFASLLGFGLARTITTPLRVLQDGVVRFGRGDYDVQLPETAQDEIGVLAREFNQAAATIAEQEAQLRTYSEHLELKVEERTLALSESEERYRTVADFTYDWEYWNAPNGDLIYISPSSERVSGYRAEEFIANLDLLRTITHPEDREKYDQHRSQVWNDNADDGLHEADFRIVQRDGEVRWINHTCQLIRRPDGTSLGRRATNRDITEKKKAEDRIRKLIRVLSVLSDTNQSIVRIRDLSTLFESVCKIAVEKGGFALVWIGLTDPAIGKIIPAAQAGKTSGYLEKFIAALNDPTQGLNQIEKDLQDGQRCLCNDLDNDPLLSFLRPEIDELGFRSSVALPLQVKDVWRGLINLYSSEPGFFDDDELHLLDEMAMDLSYAMEFNDQDVERRRAEETLKQREEIYHTLVEQASDGIFLANQDGHYIEVNSAGLRLLGYTREELLRLNVRDVTKHSHIEPLRFKELQAGKILLSERDMIRKDGSLLPVEISARQLPDGRLQGIVRDISERKRVEEALRKSQSLLNETQRITKVGGWELDLITNKITWTDEVYQIHGVSKDYDPGSSAQEIQFYAPEDQIKISEALKRAVEEGVPYNLELQFITAQGLKLWVRTIGQAERREGKISRIFGNIMDITERKLVEEEIQKLNAELEQRVVQRTQQLEVANKELEAFAYSVSHDLRAPLRAIEGFTHIIVDEYANKLDAEGNRLLNVIRTNTAKMDQLITDLLALSRATRIELKFSRVDMATLAYSIYYEITSLEVREQIIFSVSDLPIAQGDPNLLRQVWTNLLSNAIKYSTPKKERQIEVGGFRENDMNVYFVKDNGVGFNPEYTHKLFGVFQRLHKAEEFEGTGVGLAIVQRIIQRHGGIVWGEGQLNMGATFYFSLPAIEGDAL